MQFNEFKNKIFDRAQKEGFQEFELYYSSSEAFSVHVFKSEIDKYNMNSSLGVCFRGIYDGQMGYAFTEVIDEEAVELLIDKAKENAKYIEKETMEEIFEGEDSYPEIESFSDDIDKTTETAKIEMALELEKAAFDYDERVTSTQGCCVSTGKYTTRIVNSKGMNLEDSGNMFYSYIAPVVKDEENVNSGIEIHVTRNPENMDIKEVAKKAVDDGLKYFNGKSVKGGKYKVMFDNKAAK